MVWQFNRRKLRYAAVLLASLIAVAGISKPAYSQILGLRMENNATPPGGIALIRLSLTEPKPISGGQIKFALDEQDVAVPLGSRAVPPVAPTAFIQPRATANSPFGSIIGVALLSRNGDVTGNSIQDGRAVTVNFTSAGATFGTELDLPIMVIAVSVLPSATPGQTVTLTPSAALTSFTDPNGLPYSMELKPGTFTVGGVSINRITAPGSSVPSGAVLTLTGIGFQPSVRVDIEGVDASVRFVSSQQLEITTRNRFELDSARFRLRNPDGSSEIFYAIAALRETLQSPTPVPGFGINRLEMLSGRSDDVSINLLPPAASAGVLTLTSSDTRILQVPAAVSFPAGAATLTFRAFATGQGSAVVTAFLGAGTASLNVNVSAGTVSAIPVLKNDDTAVLGIALLNNGDTSADIQLRGFPATDGSTTLPVRATVTARTTLQPHQQISNFLSQHDASFQGFSGWLEVSSASPDVRALFLTMPVGRLAFAGSSGDLLASTWFVFPQASVNPLGDFSFSILNNNFQDASVLLDLTNSAGALLRRINKTLPPQGMLTSSLGSLFPDLAASLPGSYLSVRSSQPLCAYQQTLTPARLVGRIPPVPRDRAATLLLPQFTAGAPLFTEMAFINTSGALAHVTVQLLDGLGVQIHDGVQQNPRSIDLVPGQQLILDGNNLLGVAATTQVTGSLRIDTPAGVVITALSGESSRKEALTDMPIVATPTMSAVFSQLATGPVGGTTFFTGLAIQNPNPVSATVSIEVYSASGVLKGRGSVDLPAGGRTSQLLTEICPGLEPLGSGYLRVASSVPVAMIEVFANDSLDFLTTVPSSPGKH